MSQKLEELKQKMPDMSWVWEYVPQSEMVRQKFSVLGDKVTEKRDSWRTRWAAAKSDQGWLGGSRNKMLQWFESLSADSAESPANIAGHSHDNAEDAVLAMIAEEHLRAHPLREPPNTAEVKLSKVAEMNEQQRLEKLQEDMMQMQLKYQRELERLEKDNKELRAHMMLKYEKADTKRKMKRSLIDMYSDVLDKLIDYDSSYSVQDHLPRVVVVGDQSAGKTSVLEMIARARIFPRGAGEMMTRAPVKVTLSEGPYHLAQFRDSQREFDLTRESELADLRREIELRMKNSVRQGKTISTDVISLTVKGPNLPRMVLVDLPGVISTVTTDMARETKDDIIKMCRNYMENPNAIILCIQDGSVDAERSNVTDLVSSMDPGGKRTIVVLTKVDLAEENLANPVRIRRILEGTLFPMKALGYFAVITGRGNANDSIATIKKYEEEFFSKSKLFREAAFKPNQMTTQNMSMAVSDCFWKMVKESVEQQADAFKATRFNLETEWKNTFPRQRELSRDELFERARGEVLDEVVNLSLVTSKCWENELEKKLWEKISAYVVENIYIPAVLSDNVRAFNTLVDIKLKHWADSMLPKKCIDVGWETLRDQFLCLMRKDAQARDHDPLFDPVKNAAVDHAMSQHVWDPKAVDYLKVVQLNALDDRSVPDKQSWLDAMRFMEQALRMKLQQTEQVLDEMRGPSFSQRWTTWASCDDAHRRRQAAEAELNMLLRGEPTHSPTLMPEEMVVLRKTLAGKGFLVAPEELREVWHSVYRLNFFRRSLHNLRECRNFYHYYQKGFADTDSEVDCNAVVLFCRVQRMLQVTSNALRMQISNTEARRLEKEIKSVLEDWSQDDSKKKELLTGRRVDLAEELTQVRTIQEKLEEFIQALNHEKT